MFEQQSLLFVQEEPTGLQVGEQDGDDEQFGSAQSVNPSQSLSAPSLQTSATGVQPPPGARNGCTEDQ